MQRTIFILLIVTGFVLSQPVYAGKFYSETGVTYGQMKFGNLTYNPFYVRGKFGYNFTKFLAGELVVGAGAKEDNTKDTTLESPGFGGLYMRYGGSVRQFQRLYLILGYATMKVERTVDDAQFTNEYDDVSFGLGLEERITEYRNILLTFEYAQHYHKDDISIRGINLGVRVDF